MIRSLSFSMDNCADHDVQSTRSIKTKISQRARIDSAAAGLEFVNDLHGSDFRRARNRPPWQHRPQAIEQIFSFRQLARNRRHQVIYRRVRLETKSFIDPDRAVPAN